MILTNKFVNESKVPDLAKNVYSIIGGYRPLLEFSHLEKNNFAKKVGSRLKF